MDNNGLWVNLLNRKPKNGLQGSEKSNTSMLYHMTPNQSNKDKKPEQEIPLHALNLIA